MLNQVFKVSSGTWQQMVDSFRSST